MFKISAIKNLNKRTAFSLIELMVVIAIVAILASVALPAYKKYIYTSKLESYYLQGMDLAKQSILYQQLKGKFANATQLPNSPILTNAWDANVDTGGFSSDLYGTPSCPGSLGLVEVEFANDDGTAAFAFWLSNHSTGATINCTMALYPTDPGMNSVSFAKCENAGISIWSTTNTPIANAAMNSATCP